MTNASEDSRPNPAQGRTTRALLIGLVGLLLFLGYAFQGSRGLWSTDEGRYAGNAAQMIDSGNYLIPAYSPDRPNYTKPPMTLWIIAGSMRLFGSNTWAVRAPYALAYLLTALLLLAMAWRLIPEKPWLPPLIYACSLFPFMAANVVSTDVFLTLFEALAMLGFVRAYFGAGSTAGRRDLWLMWLGFGLAFLTKGPPGLVPLLGVVPFVLKRDGWPGVRRLFAPSGLLLFLLAGLSWYLLAIIRTPGLLHYFIHFEVYDRIFTRAHGRHSEWYGWIVAYVPVLTLGALPWLPALGRVIGTTAKPSHWRAWWKTTPPRLFLLLWFLVPLLVFCLAQSRLSMYVLPLFLPLSLLLALELRDRVDLQRTRHRLALAAWIVALVVIKGLAAYASHPKVDNREQARQLQALAGGISYNAVVFIRNNDSELSIEEDTPWGARIYMRRTIYGIAWELRDAKDRLCHAMARHHRAMIVFQSSIRVNRMAEALQSCPGHNEVVTLGTWRHQHVVVAGQ